MAKVETGCRDCKNCTNSGFANMGRSLGRKSLAMTSLGISSMVMATQKKCRACGHQMSLHGYTENVAPPSGIPAPVAVVSAPGGPPPGFYVDPQGSGRQRWWDGSVWTGHYQ